MHQCWKLSDPTRIFAIKTIYKLDIKKSNRTIKAVINEVDIMRDCDHPHIIKLHEVYESTKFIFLILDYLDGGELFESIKRQESFSEQMAVKVMRNVFCALQYLHKKRIVHRDLKPENLILRSAHNDEDVVIADFGLAEYMPPNGQRHKMGCGSLGYVAPEMLNGEGYDMSADIFSTGAILYTMLSGKNCFRSSD